MFMEVKAFSLNRLKEPHRYLKWVIDVQKRMCTRRLFSLISHPITWYDSKRFYIFSSNPFQPPSLAYVGDISLSVTIVYFWRTNKIFVLTQNYLNNLDMNIIICCFQTTYCYFWYGTHIYHKQAHKKTRFRSLLFQFSKMSLERIKSLQNSACTMSTTLISTKSTNIHIVKLVAVSCKLESIYCGTDKWQMGWHSVWQCLKDAFGIISLGKILA